MNNVIKSGQIDANASRVFIKNKLVVVFPKDNPKNITKLQDIAAPGVKVILADKSVPAGQYALDFLDKASATADFGADYKANVLKNVISYETDVKQVLSKVGLGEADAGIVYTSDATGDSGAQVNHIDIPVELADHRHLPHRRNQGLQTSRCGERVHRLRLHQRGTGGACQVWLPLAQRLIPS